MLVKTISKRNRSRNRLEKLIMNCVKSDIKPRFAQLWGQRSWITPAYCGVINGDGRQVVWLKTGDSRPSYYVMRIDSIHDLEADHFETEFLLEGIEEAFGNSNDYEQKYINGELKVREFFADDNDPWLPYEVSCFPKLSTDNGYWWGLIKKF